MPGTQLGLSLMPRIIYKLIQYGNHNGFCNPNDKRPLAILAILQVKSDGSRGGAICELSFLGDFLAACGGVALLCSNHLPTTT